jgi:hypothetical protein
MQLTPLHRQKADATLQHALDRAHDDQVLTAILLLEHPDHGGSPPLPSDIVDPSQFPDRVAYRKALIELRQKQMASDNAETLGQLETFQLSPRGGLISHAVVVEGTAANLLHALDLPGVSRAILDQPVSLVRPYRS